MKTSVALCSYNGEKYLNEQLDSILNQTIPVNEIVVCDDGSTDQTVAILNQYSLNHPGLFKIYQNEQNLRSVKNFEKALSLCSNEIIFLSDQDDVWELNKVEDYLTYFKTNPTINVIASNGYHMDKNSTKSERLSYWDIPQILTNHTIYFDYYRLISIMGNVATGATMAVKKEFIQTVFPFPLVKNFHHDEWIALLAAAQNSFVLLDHKYFSYRIHDGQQVGGVFFEHKRDLTELIINTYDIESDKLPFWAYKITLKRLLNSHEKYKTLLTYKTNYDSLLKNNITAIETVFYKQKKDMLRHHFVSAALLNIVDKIKNKRQLKRITYK